MLYWLSCSPQTHNARSHLLVVAPNDWPHVTPGVKSTLQTREFTFRRSEVIELARHVRDAGCGKRAPVVDVVPDYELEDLISSSVSIDLLADIPLCRTKAGPHPPLTCWRVRIDGTIFRGDDIEATERS